MTEVEVSFQNDASDFRPKPRCNRVFMQPLNYFDGISRIAHARDCRSTSLRLPVSSGSALQNYRSCTQSQPKPPRLRKWSFARGYAANQHETSTIRTI